MATSQLPRNVLELRLARAALLFDEMAHIVVSMPAGRECVRCGRAKADAATTLCRVAIEELPERIEAVMCAGSAEEAPDAD